MTDATSAAGAECPNCGTAAPLEYCGQCGQRQVDVVTLRAWLEEAAEDVVSVERGLPITVRTLLTRPGRLTRDWLEGRRQRWIRPFRLYLFSTIAFFAVSLFVPFMEPSAGASDLADPADFVRDLAMAEELRETTPRALFIMMPFFALLLKAGWPRAAPFLGHLVHALHLHSVAFLVMVVLWPAMRLPFWPRLVVWTVLIVATVVHYHLSLRRTYRTRWWRVALEGPLILGFYALLLTAVLAATAAIRSDSRTDRISDASESHYAARAALAEGDTVAAERHLADAIIGFMADPEFPYHADARWHLGQMSHEAGRHEHALTEARQGLVLDSTNLLLLGLAHEAARDLARDLEERADREAAAEDGSPERVAQRRAEAAELAAAAADYRVRLLEMWPPEMERRADQSYARRHRSFLRDYLRAAGVPEPALPPADTRR